MAPRLIGQFYQEARTDLQNSLCASELNERNRLMIWHL
jgi:hypothetical protein